MAESTFFYPTQSFECKIGGEGASLGIGQAITIYCIEGCVETVNVTIPYGENELQTGTDFLNNSAGVGVLTTSAQPVSRRIIQNKSDTTVMIDVPHFLCKGQDMVLVLKYTIIDLPGKNGISRPVRSWMDRLLGRDSSKFEVTYKPCVLDDRVDELLVRIFPPLDGIPEKWEPESNTFKMYDPGTGRVSINWQITKDVPRLPVFKVLVGKGRRPDTFPIPLFILILVIIIGLVLIDPFRKKWRRP